MPRERRACTRARRASSGSSGRTTPTARSSSCAITNRARPAGDDLALRTRGRADEAGARAPAGSAGEALPHRRAATTPGSSGADDGQGAALAQFAHDRGIQRLAIVRRRRRLRADDRPACPRGPRASSASRVTGAYRDRPRRRARRARGRSRAGSRERGRTRCSTPASRSWGPLQEEPPGVRARAGGPPAARRRLAGPRPRLLGRRSEVFEALGPVRAQHPLHLSGRPAGAARPGGTPLRGGVRRDAAGRLRHLGRGLRGAGDRAAAGRDRTLRRQPRVGDRASSSRRRAKDGIVGDRRASTRTATSARARSRWCASRGARERCPRIVPAADLEAIVSP